MNQGASEGVRTAAAAAATAVRGEHRGWTNEREQVQGKCGGYERVRRTNEHEASAGITNESEGVQTNARDGTNEGEQVRGERGGYE